jgi:hypothetical protein
MESRDILIKLLNLSSSNEDGEALSAIRHANKLIRKEGMSWEDLIRLPDLPAVIPTEEEPTHSPVRSRKRNLNNKKSTPSQAKATKPSHSNKKLQSTFDLLLKSKGLQKQTSSFNFVKNIYEFWQARGYITDAQKYYIKQYYKEYIEN